MPTLREVKEFLWAFNGQWLTRMSGPLTVPFTFLALFVPSSRLKLLFSVMAIVCALVASFGVWVIEHRARLIAEQKLKIGREDWAKLAAQFSVESQYVMATWNRWGQPAQEHWRVDVCTDRFLALLVKAGTMLMNSPRVRLGLSQDVINAADPADRWLYFLKDRKYLEDYVALPETLGNGKTANIYSGHIRKLAQRSEAVCIECEASELG